MLDQQVELSSRLAGLVERQASIAEEIERAGATQADAAARIVELEYALEAERRSSRNEGRRASHPLPSATSPNGEPPASAEDPGLGTPPHFAPLRTVQSVGSAHGPMLLEPIAALPGVRRAQAEPASPPLADTDQDEDLVDRLMVYQSRSQIARRRRLVIISLGVAVAALVVGAVVLQSLSQLWGSG